MSSMAVLIRLIPPPPQSSNRRRLRRSSGLYGRHGREKKPVPVPRFLETSISGVRRFQHEDAETYETAGYGNGQEGQDWAADEVN